LREVGIESVDQLAAADPDHLENTVEVSSGVIDGWIEQAQQRGAKADRPPIAETQNGKRVRQRLGWFTARIAAVSTVVSAYVTETVERCKRARTTGQQRVSRRVAQAQSFVRRLTVQTAKRLDTTGSELQSIDGIGPAYCERLAEMRITTVKQLAASDPERLGAAIDVSPTRVREWVIQADQEQSVVSHLRRRILVEIVRTEATATGVRTANPVLLAAVGDTRAWAVLDTGEAVAVARLSAVGIESVQQLAAADPGRIAGAVGCDVDRAATWVETAQRYREYVIHAPPERFSR
jgi:predicted flap endonuclease-1-like 5' DNA nuclease